MPTKKSGIKKSGKTGNKSNKLGYGGRSAQLKSILAKKGLSDAEIGGIIGKQARATKTAPGMVNYKGSKKIKGGKK